MSESNTGPDAPQDNEHLERSTTTADTDDNAPEGQIDGSTDNSADDADTFPREYVESLRKESAGYRDRAKTAEADAERLAKRLHAALVAATGKLENPAELSYDAEHLSDEAKLSEAIDALLADKPYLAKRRVAGDAGQGQRGTPDTRVSLLGLLNGRR